MTFYAIGLLKQLVYAPVPGFEMHHPYPEPKIFVVEVEIKYFGPLHQGSGFAGVGYIGIALHKQ
jgi:hypothetical protein